MTPPKNPTKAEMVAYLKYVLLILEEGDIDPTSPVYRRTMRILWDCAFWLFNWAEDRRPGGGF